MISLQDCMAICGLDQREIDAIAEHEHVPEIAAAALASYLLHRPKGEEKIREMIVDDLRSALKDGQIAHATELMMALRHFLAEHPDAACGAK